MRSFRSHATSREKGGLLSAGLKDSIRRERKASCEPIGDFETREVEEIEYRVD